VRARVGTAFAAALVCLTPGLVACSGSGADDDPALVVETRQGKVEGIAEEGIRSWRGIPYAAAPVGDLRWQPPQEHDDWDEVRSAEQYGSSCLQTDFPAPGQTGALPKAGSAEDCLFLNVNAPNEADGLPVMVWLHGGGFVGGTGGPSMANAPEMVKRGVVLVTLNYRLGRLGFFAHPSLEGDIANYGLLDQVAALEWVQDNIEGFGGDPDNVTLFGQSAGGMSVNALMTSPAAEGLFDKAISQSGLGRELSVSLEEARADGEQFLPGLDADALRDVDATRLLGPPQDLFAGDLPIVDEVLPMRVADAFAVGVEADVPYLTGTTNAEFPDSVFEALGRPPDAARTLLVGTDRASFLSLYGGELGLQQHVLSDVIFTEPARYLAALHSDRAPAYRYRFSIASAAEQTTLGGAPHTAEAPFVFDHGVDDELADPICEYWVSFAKTGDPNHEGAEEWPTAEDGGLLEFTAQGPVVETADPWQSRLDAVQAATERLS